MIFIRVWFYTEYSNSKSAVIEVSRSITIQELLNMGYYRVELVN